MNETTYRLALAALHTLAADIDPVMREHARVVLQDLAALESGLADDVDGYALRELISARDMAGSSTSTLVKFVDGVLALRESYVETKRSAKSTATGEAIISHILADDGKRLSDVGPEVAAREALEIVDELRRQTTDVSTLVPLPPGGWCWCLAVDGHVYALKTRVTTRIGYPVPDLVVDLREGIVHVHPKNERDDIPPEIIDALKAAHDLGPWECNAKIVPQKKPST